MAVNVFTYSQAGGANSATTTPINITGATLLVAGWAGASLAVGTTPSVSDNVGNTWTFIRRDSSAGSQTEFLLYCPNPITSTGYTFSMAQTSGFAGVTLLAANNSGSGITQSSLDKQNGASTTTTVNSFQPGAVIPTINGELIVTIDDTGESVNSVADAPFVMGPIVPAVGGLSGNYQTAMAYLVQSVTASVNPTWRLVGSGK